MSGKKKVIVFTTGGTIAMKYDPKVNGLVPAVSGEDLAAAVPGLGPSSYTCTPYRLSSCRAAPA